MEALTAATFPGRGAGWRGAGTGGGTQLGSRGDAELGTNMLQQSASVKARIASDGAGDTRIVCSSV